MNSGRWINKSYLFKLPCSSFGEDISGVSLLYELNMVLQQLSSTWVKSTLHEVKDNTFVIRVWLDRETSLTEIWQIIHQRFLVPLMGGAYPIRLDGLPKIESIAVYDNSKKTIVSEHTFTSDEISGFIYGYELEVRCKDGNVFGTLVDIYSTPLGTVVLHMSRLILTISTWNISKELRHIGIGKAVLRECVNQCVSQYGVPIDVQYTWDGTNSYVHDWLVRNFDAQSLEDPAVKKYDCSDTKDAHRYDLNLDSFMRYLGWDGRILVPGEV